MEPNYQILYNEKTGRVRVWKMSGEKRIKELKIWKDKEGYLRCKLAGKQTKVHHIAAAICFGVRPADLVVNHKDCDKCNNRPQNLEYCTVEENIRHSVENGMHVCNDPKRSGRYKDGRATKDKLVEYKRNWARNKLGIKPENYRV